ARRRLDLVPQHDDALGDDDRRSPGDSHGAETEEGGAADLPRPPEQPLHAARRALPDARDRVADAPLPPGSVRAQKRRRRVAPQLAVLRREGRLPAPDLSAGARGPP